MAKPFMIQTLVEQNNFIMKKELVCCKEFTKPFIIQTLAQQRNLITRLCYDKYVMYNKKLQKYYSTVVDLYVINKYCNKQLLMKAMRSS